MRRTPLRSALKRSVKESIKKATRQEFKRILMKSRARAKKRDLCRAELFAKLASCSSLDSITKSEKRKLFTLVRQTGFSFANGVLAPIRPEGEESQWTVLQHV